MKVKRDKKGRFVKGNIPWSKTQKGIHLSPQSEFKKGYKPWNKNKKGLQIAWNKDKKGIYSEKHIENLRLAQLGKKASEKTKEKMRKSHPRYWLGKNRSKETKKKIKRKRALQITPTKDTKIEVKIQNFLKSLGIEFFTHQYMKQIKHAYQCDILIPAMNLVIECDGNYWHKYPVGRDIDHIRTKELIEKGFKILRLWEFEINKMSINEFKKHLKTLLT